MLAARDFGACRAGRQLRRGPAVIHDDQSTEMVGLSGRPTFEAKFNQSD